MWLQINNWSRQCEQLLGFRMKYGHMRQIKQRVVHVRGQLGTLLQEDL